MFNIVFIGLGLVFCKDEASGSSTKKETGIELKEPPSLVPLVSFRYSHGYDNNHIDQSVEKTAKASNSKDASQESNSENDYDIKYVNEALKKQDKVLEKVSAAQVQADMLIKRLVTNEVKKEKFFNHPNQTQIIVNSPIQSSDNDEKVEKLGGLRNIIEHVDLKKIEIIQYHQDFYLELADAIKAIISRFTFQLFARLHIIDNKYRSGVLIEEVSSDLFTLLDIMDINENDMLLRSGYFKKKLYTDALDSAYVK